jgi:histidinol-phosphate aminotransferase
MTLSRRGFVGAIGAASTSALASPAEAARLLGGLLAQAARPADPAALIKLDQNENPNPPSDAVTNAVGEALRLGNRYPRNTASLLAALSKVHEVAPENIVLAAGSGELLRSTVLAFVDAQRPLVSGLPTFETSAGTAKALGLPVREIPIDASLRLDLPAMEAAAVGAGLLFFCNPNNPTGTTWPTADVEAMIDRVAQKSPSTTVLVDEAYAQFVERPDYRSLATRAAKDPRVLVTRTFSKAYGLAGMRVGYAVGHKDTIAALRLRTTSGFLPVTSVAAALAALGDDALVRSQIRANNEQRAAAARAFTDLGFKVYPSDANFILVDVRRKPEAFQAACRERGVAVGRPFPGLPTHARISIGTAEEMRRAATVFKDILTANA